MNRDDGKSTDNIYANDVIRGSDSVKIRSSRAAVVCLVLLCVLLLTAVIVLCVTLTQERQQLISKNENLTNERDQLTLKNTNLTNERDQLTLKNTNLTNEREQLRNELHILDRWTYYQFSFYYMPNETRSWTESRRYCTERGADLIIINNREEDDFVMKRFGGTTVYIGLTDSDVEGRWKWVDGSTLTSGFWDSGEPNGYKAENCGVIVNNDRRWPTLFGWHDVACIRDFQWICEKRISKLILP